ncbi:MAG: M16 family metallopeptidase [Deltaproteobacteria bacterium]
MQYQKKIMDNGVRLVAAPMADKNSFSVGVWLNTGARNENARISGISHFLEHIVFKGTTHYSCRKIKESIEGVGGSFNGFTSEEVTCYLVKIPARYWELAVDILSDMALYPLMKLSDVEKERQVILEEIKMYKDLPQSFVHEMLDDLLWPGQQLGCSVLGTNESMKRISRDDLMQYKKSHYTSANIVLSVAGNLELKQVEEKVKRKFDLLRKSSLNPFAPAKKAAKKDRFKLLNKNTEQAHLALGFHAVPRGHRLRYAQSLLHVILGANSSSRLFNEIRENRGLAYEIGTQVKRLKDDGAFIVHAGVANSKLEEAIKLIFSELARIREKPVQASELSRAKEFYTGQLLLSLEDTLDHMLWIGEPTVTLDKTYTLEEVVRQIREVTSEDIQAVAKLILPEKTGQLALIGPFKGREKRLEGLLR